MNKKASAKKPVAKAKSYPWFKYYKEDGIPETLEFPDCSIVDMIIQTAEKYPDNIAYSYYGHKVTYKNFVRKIEKTARALKNYGVKEGDRVTICMPNTPEGITMVYAVNMVGAVCNMVHPLSSEKELEYYIKVAESKYVLVIDAVFDKIYKLRDTAQLERIIVVRPSDGLGFLKQKLYRLLPGWREVLSDFPGWKPVAGSGGETPDIWKTAHRADRQGRCGRSKPRWWDC